MPRRPKTYHYIYRTTCLVTGKFYIGMHSTDTLDDGYLGSGKVLWYSIRKHGRENHRRDIVEMCSTREALKLREKEIVNEQLLADPLNINLKYGGEGGGRFWNEEHRRKAQAAGGTAANKIRSKRLAELHNDVSFKKRFSDALKANAVGTKGQVWVKRGGETACIAPDKLESYLAAGWMKGRNYKRNISPQRRLSSPPVGDS